MEYVIHADTPVELQIMLVAEMDKRLEELKNLKVYTKKTLQLRDVKVSQLQITRNFVASVHVLPKMKEKV